MGTVTVERLLAQGHRLTAWNRTAGRAAVLVTRGATQATPPIMFNFSHPVAANWRRAQKTCAA
jgi:3-hydroxyisobutyrate dehydrogenase-like beta-hydroxyacid dehydrogenase